MITESRLDKIKKILKKRLKNIVIVLENIKNKHNAGAILRTCDAFGIGYVCFIFDEVFSYNPFEIVSSSVGSSKWIVYEIFSKEKYENPQRACLEKLKTKGYKLVATIVDKKAKSIFEFQWPKKVAILFGNEIKGLSQYLIENSDYKIYIPMLGMVESLNVSVAAGICFYDFLYKKIMSNEIKFIDKSKQKEWLEKILKNKL